MLRKLIFVAFVALLIISVMPIAAQDANWCFPGQPWGDGRCENPDPDVTAYYWQVGWCMANDIDPAEMAVGVVEYTAVDDFYGKDMLKSFSFNYVPASEGLLANDLGEGIEIISYDKELSRRGDLLVWPDGSFRIRNAKPGEHVFHYTVTGGAKAEVRLRLR